MSRTSMEQCPGAQERISNLKNAFRLLRADKIREPVLLIDDIYTTGATANHCARVLKETGAAEVHVLVLATGSDFAHGVFAM